MTNLVSKRTSSHEERCNVGKAIAGCGGAAAHRLSLAQEVEKVDLYLERLLVRSLPPPN